MRVFIIAEGGQNIGFGHITRCFSLYQAFLEMKVEPTFVVNGDESLRYFWETTGIKPVSFNQNIYKNFGSEDVVIIDSYLLPEEFYEEVGQRVKLLVSMDDFKRLEYPAGIVVNGSILTEEMDYPHTGKVEYCLGTKFTPLRKVFWEVKTGRVRNKVKNV